MFGVIYTSCCVKCGKELINDRPSVQDICENCTNKMKAPNLRNVAIDSLSKWETLNNDCPWKTISSCCAATKIKCSEEFCALAYWESKKECGCNKQR